MWPLLALLAACSLDKERRASAPPAYSVADSAADSATDSAADSGTGPACVDSTSLVDAAGAATGFEQCADGTVHRVEALATDTASTETTCPYTAEDADVYDIECTTDADCTTRPYGRCVHMTFGEGPGGCGCSYSCASDADCEETHACVPDGLVEGIMTHSACMHAGCRTDADCASGECGLSWFNNGCGWVVQLACRSEADTCRVSGECFGDDCAMDWETGAWGCVRGDCEE